MNHVYHTELKVSRTGMVMLDNPKGWHGLVLDLFPARTHHAQERTSEKSVLYRVENHRVLVQSTDEPINIDCFAQKHKAVEQASCCKIDMDFPDEVEIEVIMAVQRRFGNKERPLIDESDKIQLFCEKITECPACKDKKQDCDVCNNQRLSGTKVLDVTVTQTTYFNGRSFEKKQERYHEMSIPVAVFVARLALDKNRTPFIDLVRRGIGRKRGHGVGLITTHNFR